jgi:hypothetical protein
MRCVRCQASGVCPPCKGSGHSGYFLSRPTADSPLCWCCNGSGRCNRCGGTGRIQYEPQIFVKHSLRFPSSITFAAITGGFWRYLRIPRWVRRRSPKAQLHWVGWRVRQHFIENHGKLHLFGDITGYRYDLTRDMSIELDTNGRYIKTVHWRPVQRDESAEKTG